MVAPTSPARVAYQAAITGVWLVGVVVMLRLTALLYSGAVDIEPPVATTIALVNAAMALISILSFWMGAQAGHWVRAVNVGLFTLFVGLMYAAYLEPVTDLSIHARTWVVGVVIIMLNMNYARRFKREYREHGRVNYFERYFP